MRFIRQYSRPLIALLFAFGLIGVAGLLVHELGHGITAELLGGKFNGLFVMPGVQIWPNPGEVFPNDWQGYIGLVDFTYGSDWENGGWQAGLVEIMGSGSNLIFATLALAVLWLFRPNGWIRYLLIAESLVFIDLLFYTFLPTFGLRHWVFFGGDTAEPLLGALKLGIPVWIFMLFVALVSSMILWSIVMFVRKYPVDRYLQLN